MFGRTVDYRRLLQSPSNRMTTIRETGSAVPSLFNGLGIVMSVTIHDEAVVCKGAVLKGTVAIGAGIPALNSPGRHTPLLPSPPPKLGLHPEPFRCCLCDAATNRPAPVQPLSLTRGHATCLRGSRRRHLCRHDHPHRLRNQRRGKQTPLPRNASTRTG